MLMSGHAYITIMIIIITIIITATIIIMTSVLNIGFIISVVQH